MSTSRPRRGPASAPPELAWARLRDGSEVVLRTRRAGDEQLLATAPEPLALDARRQELLATGAGARRASGASRPHDDTLLATSVAAGDLLAIARCSALAADPASAAATVVVVDEWRRCGLATALLQMLSERARRAGITRYVMWVASDDPLRMRRLERLGARPAAPVDLPDHVRYELMLTLEGLDAARCAALFAVLARQPAAARRALTGVAAG